MEPALQRCDDIVGIDVVAGTPGLVSRAKASGDELGLDAAALDTGTHRCLDELRQALALGQHRLDFGPEFRLDTHGRDGRGLHGGNVLHLRHTVREEAVKILQAMGASVWPRFIDDAAGHSSKRRPQAVLDFAGTDTIQPESEQYCKESLTESAYAHATQAGIAFDARGAHGGHRPCAGRCGCEGARGCGRSRHVAVRGALRRRLIEEDAMKTNPAAAVALSDHVVLALFPTHEAADGAVRSLGAAGVPLAAVSLIGKNDHSDEQPLAYFHVGDRAKFYGKRGAFWGGLAGMLLGSGFFFVPAVGSIMVLGPLASIIVGGLEGAVLAGGASALVGALTTAGLPRDSVLRYEDAIKADQFLVTVHANQDQTARIAQLLADAGGTAVEAHPLNRLVA